jgi:hypothetical protein
MTACVTLEALARPAAGNTPPRRVMPTRRTTQHHAPAFEVQHLVVATEPTEELRETSGDAHAASFLARDLRAGRG